MSTRVRIIFVWILRLIAATIMLQTLFFKFSGANESVYIFSQLGVEPWGRIGTGIMELIASVLILYPASTVFGALLGIGIMSGAILSHIFKLGIEVQNDGGQLFIYALLTFFSSLALVIIYRNDLFRIARKILFKL